MELKMNYNSFIKLKDFFKVIDINAEVDEFNTEGLLIEGNLTIKGKYLKRDNVTSEYFNEMVPFSISMNMENIDVEDIYCVDLEYVGVEARGIDISFDIFINYNKVLDDEREEIKNEEIYNNVDSLEEIDAIPVDNNDFEYIKEVETSRIDTLLKNTLSIKDDNSPTEEVIIRGLGEDLSKIKICYYNNDKELEEICVKNELSLDNIFKTNQKYEFNKYHRVILNDK